MRFQVFRQKTQADVAKWGWTDMDGPPVISSNVAMENTLRKCGGV